MNKLEKSMGKRQYQEFIEANPFLKEIIKHRKKNILKAGIVSGVLGGIIGYLLGPVLFPVNNSSEPEIIKEKEVVVEKYIEPKVIETPAPVIETPALKFLEPNVIVPYVIENKKRIIHELENRFNISFDNVNIGFDTLSGILGRYLVGGDSVMIDTTGGRIMYLELSDQLSSQLESKNDQHSLEGVIIHEVGHDFYYQIRAVLIKKGNIDRTHWSDNPQTEIITEIIDEGIAEYFVRELGGIENHPKNSSYVVGYGIVKSILDRLGVEKGTESILINPILTLEEVLNDPEKYQKRILQNPSLSPEDIFTFIVENKDRIIRETEEMFDIQFYKVNIELKEQHRAIPSGYAGGSDDTIFINPNPHNRLKLSKDRVSVEGSIIHQLGRDFYHQIWDILAQKGQVDGSHIFAYGRGSNTDWGEILSRGISVYFVRGLGGIENHPNISSYVTGYGIVKPILDSLGVEKGIESILINPVVTQEEADELEKYQKRIFQNPSNKSPYEPNPQNKATKNKPKKEYPKIPLAHTDIIQNKKLQRMNLMRYVSR